MGARVWGAQVRGEGFGPHNLQGCGGQWSGCALAMASGRETVGILGFLVFRVVG